jgi:LmbE family N-acetylglucosaminyl deacetylase
MSIHRLFKTLFWALFLIPFTSISQPRWDAAQVQLELEKFGTVGNALYLAAHPDDENTRLIAWLANQQKVRTAYLSLTRGDGGQNLIGDEKGALMGLIRTQELREARQIDGGEQFFTRALDFGYSKSSDETLEKWVKDSIMADVVMTIRKFKPDVIVLRFPPNSRAGHGHHSTSAILAEEAFQLAADETQFTASAKKYGTWQAKRIFFNDSPWWDKDIADRKDEYVTVDVGEYNPLLGRSFTEIAGMSRSQHSSQGFGAALAKGEQIEYLKLIDGAPTEHNDLFEGVDLSWFRVEGGKAIQSAFDKIMADYNVSEPHASVPALANLYESLEKLPDNPYKAHKLNHLKQIIAACSGLWFEYLAKDPYTTPSGDVDGTIEVLAQLSANITLKSVRVNEFNSEPNQAINNAMFELPVQVESPIDITNPYWLQQDAVHDMFLFSPKEWLGLPQNPAFVSAQLTFEIEGVSISYEAPVQYKWVDRAQGELYREVNVIPEITLTPEAKTMVFTDESSKTLTLKVQSHGKQSQRVRIEPIVPKGWRIAPNNTFIDNLQLGDVEFVKFEISPNKKTDQAKLTFEIGAFNQEEVGRDLIEITYPHIQTQVVMPVASTKLVSAPAKRVGEHVGYIMGAGDEVPTAIEQLGYDLTFIDPNIATLDDLSAFDAVVVGVRAYNKIEAMATFHSALNEYVENGGHVVVQYNTNRGLKTENIGPYPLQLSRKRVTVEEAPVTFLNENHPLLTSPNKITVNDFDHWIQERGLYFADEWDEQYTPVLEWNDPGEDPQKGSLLVTNYGQGTYIFTGISFFRELPAGVPGAYRLFANILSYRQQK